MKEEYWIQQYCFGSELCSRDQTRVEPCAWNSAFIYAAMRLISSSNCCHYSRIIIDWSLKHHHFTGIFFSIMSVAYFTDYMQLVIVVEKENLRKVHRMICDIWSARFQYNDLHSFKIYMLLAEREVRIGGYLVEFFFLRADTDRADRRGPSNARKERDQISSYPDRTSSVNNLFIIWLTIRFKKSCC